MARMLSYPAPHRLMADLDLSHPLALQFYRVEVKVLPPEAAAPPRTRSVLRRFSHFTKLHSRVRCTCASTQEAPRPCRLTRLQAVWRMCSWCLVPSSGMSNSALLTSCTSVRPQAVSVLLQLKEELGAKKMSAKGMPLHEASGCSYAAAAEGGAGSQEDVC